MNKMNPKVCIFCAASNLIDNLYMNATKDLASLLVKNNIDIVYGGGAIGLMGILADTVLKNGGNITGVIPKFMIDLEWAHPGVKDMIIVNDLHERKKKYLEGIDAVIALPGGNGTLEELLEVITLKKLKLFSKPIIIYNINGYFDYLHLLLEHFIKEKFMNSTDRELWQFETEPKDVILSINE